MALLGMIIIPHGLFGGIFAFSLSILAFYQAFFVVGKPPPLPKELKISKGAKSALPLDFDWEKSPAHLLLLSRFRSANSLDSFLENEDWEEVLDEKPEMALWRFFKNDLLKEADLHGHLDCEFRVVDLRPMLKERGLKISGRKAELIERLVQADPNGMKQAVQGLNAYQCTEKGESISGEFISQEKEKRAEVDKKIITAFQENRFEEASRLVIEYEAQKVFPRGGGIIGSLDWKNLHPSFFVEDLILISNAKPKILSALNEDQMEILKPAAAMEFLWGDKIAYKFIPKDFQTNLEMKNVVAARMIWFYASQQMDLMRDQEQGYETYEIETLNDSCEACKKLGKKEYTINDLPEIPYEKCTHEYGCRCHARPTEI